MWTQYAEVALKAGSFDLVEIKRKDGDQWELEESADGLVRDSPIKMDDRSQRHLFVITDPADEDEVIATLFYSEHRDDEYGKLFDFSVVVDKRFQRKGLAKKLIKDAEKWAKRKRFEAMKAWTVNPNMNALLESIGYDGDDDHMYKWL